MAQVVECLSIKHKALSSNSSTIRKPQNLQKINLHFKNNVHIQGVVQW
jgi:hypothetical protein